MAKIFLQEYDGYTLEWLESSMAVISKPGKLDMGWKPGIDLSNITKLEANLLLHAYHLAMKGGFTPVPSGYEWFRDEIPYLWWSPDGSIHKYVWMGYMKDCSGCWYPFNFISDKHRLSESFRRAQQLRLLRDVDKKLEVKTTWHSTAFEDESVKEAGFEIGEKYIIASANNQLLKKDIAKLKENKALDDKVIRELRNSLNEEMSRNLEVEKQLRRVKIWFNLNSDAIRYPSHIDDCYSCDRISKERYEELKNILGV